MSRLTVRGVAGGILKSLGHDPVLGVRDFAGKVRFDPEAPEHSALNMTVKSASLEVQNNASEKDRREMKRVMDEEVLEIADYPEIAFHSEKITSSNANGSFYRAQVQGILALHGVKRKLNIPVQVMAAGDTLRASGEFSLLQTDFRIEPPAVAAGALKLKDELKFTFDILARRKAELES
jgi:polyisoprenoid-binding protein YceI